MLIRPFPVSGAQADAAGHRVVSARAEVAERSKKVCARGAPACRDGGLAATRDAPAQWNACAAALLSLESTVKAAGVAGVVSVAPGAQSRGGGQRTAQDVASEELNSESHELLNLSRVLAMDVNRVCHAGRGWHGNSRGRGSCRTRGA